MIRALTLLLAFCLAVPAAAHQQKIAISTVSHNPRTEMLEVVHRVPVHDAEHALQARGVKAPDVLSDIESRRAFARYLAERFSIDVGGQPVPLTLLGSEIEGRTLYVYQEAKSPGPGATLRIQSQVLTDIWSRQENRVNLGTGTSVETLIFRAGTRPQEGTLP